MNKERNKYEPKLQRQAKKFAYAGSVLLLVIGIVMTVFNFTSTGLTASRYGGGSPAKISGPEIIAIACFIFIFARFFFRGK